LSRAGKKGFTLIELLIVISVISLLTGMLLPALSNARRQARALKGVNNQRQVGANVTVFAMDHNDRYPESVATIGQGTYWNWSDPRVLIAAYATYPGRHRAMSEHLDAYIEDVGIMYCPNAPRKYKYFKAAWDAGDTWDNPDNLFPRDPMTGTYCFYWNYTGYLAEDGRLFVGPKSITGGRRQSNLLMTDYFGYDHWRSRDAYGSCEDFAGAIVTAPNLFSAAFWFDGSGSSSVPELKLQAVYTDGHVESFTSCRVVTMKVIKDRSESEPYEDGFGPGNFYLPADNLF